MGTLILAGGALVLCSNASVAQIVASTGVLLHIAGIKQGKQIAVGSGVIYTVVKIVTSFI